MKLALCAPPCLSAEKGNLGGDVMHMRKEASHHSSVSLFISVSSKLAHISFLSPLSHVFVWSYTPSSLPQGTVGFFQTLNRNVPRLNYYVLGRAHPDKAEHFSWKNVYNTSGQHCLNCTAHL